MNWKEIKEEIFQEINSLEGEMWNERKLMYYWYSFEDFDLEFKKEIDVEIKISKETAWYLLHHLAISKRILRENDFLFAEKEFEKRNSYLEMILDVILFFIKEDENMEFTLSFNQIMEIYIKNI